MFSLANRNCSGSDYSGYSNLVQKCNASCAEANAKTENIDCCKWKCAAVDHSLLAEGKINKTALTSLFGEAGDPKMMENID